MATAHSTARCLLATAIWDSHLETLNLCSKMTMFSEMCYISEDSTSGLFRVHPPTIDIPTINFCCHSNMSISLLCDCLFTYDIPFHHRPQLCSVQQSRPCQGIVQGSNWHGENCQCVWVGGECMCVWERGACVCGREGGGCVWGEEAACVCMCVVFQCRNM